MPRPVAVCLEDLIQPGYLACTVLPEGEKGLWFDAAGAVNWAGEGQAVCFLEVDQAGHLVLRYEQDTTVELAVARSGRSFEPDRPVSLPLFTGDELRIGERSYRLHIHGDTETVEAPRPVTAPPDPSEQPDRPLLLPVRVEPPAAPDGAFEEQEKALRRLDRAHRIKSWLPLAAVIIVLALVLLGLGWWWIG